jgi:formylglycine-generating enzyme required for sulfatase activity
MKSLKFLALLLIIIPILFSCESTTETNTVATPVITPDSGTYTSAQSVQITCATSGATIYYTMDGTDPTTASAVYAGALTVSSNMTIKAMATKDELNDSAIATKIYVVYDNMVSVPAGTFTMGRTTGTGYNDETPTHSVTLDAFYIGKYEVTQADWYAVMNNNPSEFTGNNNRPVEMVSFYAVLVYCNKKSMNEDLVPAYSISGSTDPDDWGAIPTTNSAAWNAVTCNLNATGYRLPTEAEWEYAARGAVNTPDYLYSGSNTPGDVAWYGANSGNMTHEVGGKAANALGIYDMSGNVQEWVWDWYGAYSSAAQTNPTGPASNVNNRRVVRGGSWNSASNYTVGMTDIRIPFRNWGTPEKGDDKVTNDKLGFRVVRKAI